jgi:hypothetical protein
LGRTIRGRLKRVIIREKEVLEGMGGVWKEEDIPVPPLLGLEERRGIGEDEHGLKGEAKRACWERGYPQCRNYGQSVSQNHRKGGPLATMAASR